MECICNKKSVIRGNKAVDFKNKCLNAIKVDAINWIGIYKCQICGEYWKESFLDGRWGGTILLEKISKEEVEIK